LALALECGGAGDYGDMLGSYQYDDAFGDGAEASDTLGTAVPAPVHARTCLDTDAVAENSIVDPDSLFPVESAVRGSDRGAKAAVKDDDDSELDFLFV
jgi:hypothetical protein